MLYSVVLVSAIQQCESVVSLHIPFPLEPPSHLTPILTVLSVPIHDIVLHFLRSSLISLSNVLHF